MQKKKKELANLQQRAHVDTSLAENKNAVYIKFCLNMNMRKMHYLLNVIQDKLILTVERSSASFTLGAFTHRISENLHCGFFCLKALSCA